MKFFKLLTLLAAVLFSLGIHAGEKDPLHKRSFNVKIAEIKEDNTGPSKKPVMDKWSFKDGRMFSDFLYDKLQYKWLKYRINKDSIYTDSTDTEVRLLEVESVTTDAANQTVSITFTVLEWDLDGEIKITKNDKMKKHYLVTAREKGGKPKKPKKKKKKIDVNVGDGEKKEDQ